MTRKLLFSTAIGAIASTPALAGAGPYGFPAGLIEIRCSRPGMRRNGVAHPAVETYPLDRWSEEELQIFEDDPHFQVFYEPESSVAPGASMADAIQDQGAGLPVPDLGAKPDGTGPASIPAGLAGTSGAGDVAVVANERVAAIAAVLPNLVAPIDFTAAGEPRIESIRKAVGFEPTRAEVDAAIGLKPAAVI